MENNANLTSVRDDIINALTEIVFARRDDLKRITSQLSVEARKNNRNETWATSVIVILGASVTIREILSSTIGNSAFLTLLFALIGLVIVAIAGLQAAFKWQDRATEVSTLVAECKTAIRQIESRHKKILLLTLNSDINTEIREIITFADEALESIETRAASLHILTVETPDENAYVQQAKELKKLLQKQQEENQKSAERIAKAFSQMQ